MIKYGSGKIEGILSSDVGEFPIQQEPHDKFLFTNEPTQCTLRTAILSKLASVTRSKNNNLARLNTRKAKHFNGASMMELLALGSQSLRLMGPCHHLVMSLNAKKTNKQTNKHCCEISVLITTFFVI
jgi:hypothetical protein